MNEIPYWVIEPTKENLEAEGIVTSTFNGILLCSHPKEKFCLWVLGGE